MNASPPLRLLISGGPGSGCTSTARAVSAITGVPSFDTDDFFHKPTDPPYQAQYSPEERRGLLVERIGARDSWILGGSIATWDAGALGITHGVLLDVGKTERIRRLLKRERERFGDEIEVGGAMHPGHLEFMAWAAGYESRTGVGRNLATDRRFVRERCGRSIEIRGPLPFDAVRERILEFCGHAP